MQPSFFLMRRVIRLLLVFSVIIGLFSASLANAQTVETQNVVILKGLRYSVFPFFARERVRIYAALQNYSGYDVGGIITFRDNASVIANSAFSAVNGSIIEVWGDAVFTKGDHVVSARISRAEKHELGKDAETLKIQNGFLETTLFVDEDADRDRIGNADDPDDDNDGIADDKEIISGTNPLVKNAERANIESAPEKEILEASSQGITQKISNPIVEGAQKIQKSLAPALSAAKKLARANEVLTKNISSVFESEKVRIEQGNPPQGSVGKKPPENKPNSVFAKLYMRLLGAVLFLIKIWPILVILIIYFIINWKLRKRKW